MTGFCRNVGGQEYVSDDLHHIYGFSGLYEGCVAVHADTELYKWDFTDLTEIATVSDKQSTFLEFNGLLYLIDGENIWQINHDYTVAEVNPYSPVVYINCAPDMSASTPNEDFNLIGSGFKVWYSGDGTTTTYNLPVKLHAASNVTITVGTSDLTEGTHFTVNRTSGIISFTGGTAPHGAPAKATNNVVITAYKTGAKDKIAKCKIAVPFGGESTEITGGTRAFLTGNPDYPRTYWYCDLGAGQGYGMTYFPDTQFEELVQNNEKITAIGKQTGEMIIFKERSVFAVSYEFDGENVFYPIREINSSIGCDMPKSVQLIDNKLVFANTYGGIHMIVSTQGIEENIKPISGNINGTKQSPGLLQEPNLATATSVDYDRKYWLCVGNIVYLWDYELTPFYGYSNYEKAQRRLSWFKLSNIISYAWYGGTSLYYARGGRIVKFIPNRSDFGEPIKAYWRSKAFDFGAPNYLKTITKIYPSLRVDTSTSVEFTVLNEKKEPFFTKNLSVSNFNWASFNWTTFSWSVLKFAKTFGIKNQNEENSVLSTTVLQ